MSLNVLPILFALFCFASDSPESISTQAIGAAGSNGPLVMISRFVSPRLTLFDFEQGTGRTIDDGRLRMMFGFPVAYDDGFAVISLRLGMIYLLDRNGNFIGQMKLTDISGFDSSFRVQHVTAESNGVALLTLIHRGDQLMVLARLIIAEQRMEILTRRAWEPPERSLWLKVGNQLLLMSENTGRIVEIDPQTFRTRSTIHPGREPIKRDARPGRNPYHGIIEIPVIVGDSLYLTHRRFPLTGDHRDEPQLEALEITGKQVRHHPYKVFGQFGRKRLVYDLQKDVFRLEETGP